MSLNNDELISDKMIALNKSLHIRQPNYGTASRKHTGLIYEKWVKPFGLNSVLDYGCGKNHFYSIMTQLAPEIFVMPYDPCMPQFDRRPEGTFDGVLCHDVLEHIEYENVDAVLKDIYNYSKKYIFLSIGMGPGYKTLDDGRDNHLIQEPSTWWRKKLEEHNIEIIDVLEDETNTANPKVPLFVVTCRKKEGSKSMPVTYQMTANMQEGVNVTLTLQNDIDWDFTNKYNPGIVKQSQNLREFDKWITWIKETFPMDRPFNYLEIGSYAGESLYYLSQVFPRNSIITLVDLGDNQAARNILIKTINHITKTYGHKVNLFSGYSNNEQIRKQVLAYPQGQQLYDMVFIDANHDFGWAYMDYLGYRTHASWTAFHDISDFNIVKTTLKYGKEIANAAHLWKSITTVIPPTEYVEFIDYDNSVDMKKFDLKPRGIGVLKN